MLCIDVSGSMDGTPIIEAVRGAGEFVAEAVAAHYNVGVMLWNTGVVALAEPTPDGATARQVLVKMALDGDGILRVTAHDGVSGALITQVEVHREGAMSTGQQALAAAALDDVMVV